MLRHEISILLNNAFFFLIWGKKKIRKQQQKTRCLSVSLGMRKSLWQWFIQKSDLRSRRNHGPWHLPAARQPRLNVAHTMMTYSTKLPQGTCQSIHARMREHPTCPLPLNNPSKLQCLRCSSPLLQQWLAVLPQWEGSFRSFKQEQTSITFPKTPPSFPQKSLRFPQTPPRFPQTYLSDVLGHLGLWPNLTVFFLFPLCRRAMTPFGILWAMSRAHPPPSTYYHLWNQSLPDDITDTFTGVCDCSHNVLVGAKQCPGPSGTPARLS